MTLYEKFRSSGIDTSPLGLGRGNEEGGYFCTPVGAKVIGWAGVDGIHFCFVEGFGEMVFAVSPMNPAGKNVYPLARSFEDFLRLLLACGDTAALEQAWMWNRGEFDGFLETYPPEPDQRAVLDGLGDKLGLAPMDDPFAYIKTLQGEFDYGSIPFSEEYYDLAPDEPESQPPERPEWAVYSDGGYFQPAGGEEPGTEIPVNKTFAWAGRTWHVPAVYACGKGLVVDFCVEIDPAAHAAFQEKWRPQVERGELTPEEREQWMAENPSRIDFNPKATVNGRELRPGSGSGFGWIPLSLRPEWEREDYGQQDWEAMWLMEHYGLDAEKGWLFLRRAFPWEEKTELKTLSLWLEQRPIPVPGPRFTVSGAGEEIPFTHPVTGQGHTLHVAEYEQREMDQELLARMEDGEWEYPPCYTAMAYAVWPELPWEELTVRDCGEGDRPRRKPSANPNEFAVVSSAMAVGVIGGADGPTVVLLSNGTSAGQRGACSAMRFAPPEQIQWRMVFYHKAVEDIQVALLPS